MDNLDKIIAKIIEEAEIKSRSIAELSRKNVEEFKNNESAKFEQRKQEIYANYEEEKKSTLERTKSSVELKCKSIILQAKQECIKYIFRILKNKIDNITIDMQKQYIQSKLDNRKLEENEILILPKSLEIIKFEYNNVKYSDSIKAGFMIEKDGVFENNTLDALINYKKDEIEEIIQKSIFKN